MARIYINKRNISAMTGAVRDLSMWNTLTNVLRIMAYIVECYYCAEDDGFYETADGYIYEVWKK